MSRPSSGTAFGFRYNRLDELEAIVAEHQLAAVVMEPIREHDPEPGFLPGVVELARRAGAVLIFDEVTSGLRVNGGIHLELGVEPDVAVFAKAIGNGYPMAAVLGRAAVLERAQRSFVSSTYWTERIGPAAALATLRRHRANSVGTRLTAVGAAVQAGWRAAAEEVGLAVRIHGIAPLSHLRFVEQPQPSVTLFTQLMLDQGFLAGGSSIRPSRTRTSMLRSIWPRCAPSSPRSARPRTPDRCRPPCADRWRTPASPA